MCDVELATLTTPLHRQTTDYRLYDRSFILAPMFCMKTPFCSKVGEVRWIRHLGKPTGDTGDFLYGLSFPAFRFQMLIMMRIMIMIDLQISSIIHMYCRFSDNTIYTRLKYKSSPLLRIRFTEIIYQYRAKYRNKCAGIFQKWQVRYLYWKTETFAHKLLFRNSTFGSYFALEETRELNSLIN